ncbi:ammonia-forming cytochrome c nitrite reductase subunit c552 [Slackia exigua]|uniref:ammonia-forming cytochrome c nitrite reductase subunit c552 n=1 Tax=Slackia exigua TaxID=84109 RepID=UPI0028DC8101|nr:ammonia-forming cytochrome c nitrite reductase subunit c552 [Slackia exigua]
MFRTQRGKKTAIVVSVTAALCLVVGIVGCAPKDEAPEATEPAATGGTTMERPVAAAPTTVPEADEFGIIESESWADQYPNQYNTFVGNEANKWPEGKHNYNDNEHYPEMVTLGKGYGYANFFTEAGGHTYSLYTVANNGRVSVDKTKAQCLACKTPLIHAEVQKMGDSAWTRPMYDVLDTYTEGISCANCHVNDDPTQFNVLRADWVRAMGPDYTDKNKRSAVCGQCHCDYSMDAKTGTPTSPYDGGLATMTPDQALKWYDDNGYADWTYESTGAKMIAVRHSEYEYNFGGSQSPMVKMGYECADCHMPIQTADDGTAYTSHYWQSPLDNEETLAKCNTCHKDLKSEIKGIQDDIDGRTHQIGMRCANFVKNFEAAIDEGTLSDDDLARLQQIQREATFYWNSAFAENSEGAHNPELYTSVLDSADKLLDEGDQILGVASSADKFVSEYNPDNPKDAANYPFPAFEGVYVYYTAEQAAK